MTTSRIAVTVAYAAPDAEAIVVVMLPRGATVDDAIARSGMVAALALDPTLLEFAIFGRRAKGQTPLEDGDRVELTRPLVADPKRARRKRADDQPKARSNPQNNPRG
jgi:putative ubiquitin-RnfH superfamily antitoxin RatB of RatAB toxin-antitoxin module